VKSKTVLYTINNALYSTISRIACY